MLTLVPLSAFAGTFQMSGSVDKTELDLGDSLQYTLTISVEGNPTFQPTMAASPTFDGFDVQGPTQSQSFSWINGASTDVYTWTWTLEAKQPGRFKLGPYRASANDALNGVIERETKPITITVRHPKGLAYPLPELTPQTQAAPDVAAFHGIKPDWAASWILAAEAFGLLIVLLALLAWVAQRNPPVVVEEVLPSDPVQAAFARLDKAQKSFLVSADGRVYSAQVGEALRQYLRQRLDLRPGLTLGEAVRALRLRAPQVGPGRVQALRQRLELLLYGGLDFQPEEQAGLDLDARALIRGLEDTRKLTPAQQALSKSLDRMAALWREGQVKSAWMGMRSAWGVHARKSLGLGPGSLPRAVLGRMLKPLDAPELSRVLDALFTEQPPRGADPALLASRILSLAQALDALNKELFAVGSPPRGEGAEDVDTDSSTEPEGDA
ncbi:MAG: BatD family protein [bacterium]